MKSEHRHELETNALAQRLDTAIHRIQPHLSTIAGVAVALIVVMFAWSYLSSSSTARRSQAWDEFNLAVAEVVPDANQLRQAAQEHPGSAMQRMADATWADSQVWLAARDYIYNRAAAVEALSKATSVYQAIIQSSDDARLKNRAQLGLARVYELQGKFDEAREEYLKVGGGYQQYAKLQAERLAQPESKAMYAWLESARPPLPQSSLGGATAGQRPAFSEGELALPGENGVLGTSGSQTAPDPSIDDLLKGLELDLNPPDGKNDRYAPAPGEPAQAAPGETPATNAPSADAAPATPDVGGDRAPADEAPANSENPPAASEATATPPSSEKPAE